MLRGYNSTPRQRYSSRVQGANKDKIGLKKAQQGSKSGGGTFGGGGTNVIP